MATTDLSQFPPAAAKRPASAAPTATRSPWLAVLAPLSSLKLTVVLFALSMVLIMAGTLAQVDHDIWYVIDTYFRAVVAWIDIQVFLPRAWDVHFNFPFPGGWLIGGALGANLLAAHAFRFTATARGRSLAAGLALLAVGALLVWATVQSGVDDAVESELSAQFCNNLWHALRAALGGGALAAAYYLALRYHEAQRSVASWAWWLAALATAGLLTLSVWLFLNPDARLNPSGLRILWQLIKGTGASLVLWAGCRLTFGKRAGVVLLHSGIALMMFSELYTGLTAVESHMRLFEGEPKSYAEDIRTAELAVVDKSDARIDRVVTVPRWKLLEAAETGALIEHPALPAKIRVHQYLTNASVRLGQPGDAPPRATAGVGLVYRAVDVRSATGVDMEQAVDVPAVFFELVGSDDQSSGVLLGSPHLSADGIELGDLKLETNLQFKRYDKPYSLTLLDFEHEKFIGSDKPKSFKSRVRLQDSELGEDREVLIWMNNPLRYRGDTLYQHSFAPGRTDYTELQVVNNFGWMIPYVACMIVATGMLAHFGSLLMRFLKRREEDAARRTTAASPVAPSAPWTQRWKTPAYWGPAMIVAIFALWLVGRARPPQTPPSKMQIEQFGQLPVAVGGRVQPVDTLARNTLRQISDSEVLRAPVENPSWLRRLLAPETKSPAALWLLDTVSRAPGWRDHRVFRIQNLEVLQLLGLQPRSRYRYSFNDLTNRDGGAELDRQVQLAIKAQQRAAKDGRELALVQRKILELRQKTDRVMILLDAFGRLDIDPSSAESMQASIARMQERLLHLEKANPPAPRPVPPASPDGRWQTLLEADRQEVAARLLQRDDIESNPAAVQLQTIFAARRQGDVAQFNSAVSNYAELVEQRAAAEAEFEAKLEKEGGKVGRKPAERLAPGRLEFEAAFNHFSPFVLCIALYIAAFVLAALALLGWSEGLNRSANWLLWLTFALHTYALWCRILISGRPPVTNLYSSAVFIGWGAVLFALVFEIVYRMGLGNILAAAIGFPTMLIAYYLAGDGDTFEVLQAVLDTQFWLATHVVCITLGYATTFLAGALGLAYLFASRFSGQLDGEQRRQIERMTYGTVCFSIFFSFVGTVLGGLWADDSWGRFWGWDPKENGALLIVIWNAIVLHARWGRLIGPVGLAVLAVFGNVVVAWSWFGVNQLGVGLHAYGFTEGRTFWLLMFVLSQLIAMAVAWLPEAKPREAA